MYIFYYIEETVMSIINIFSFIASYLQSFSEYLSLYLSLSFSAVFCMSGCQSHSIPLPLCLPFLFVRIAVGLCCMRRE